MERVWIAPTSLAYAGSMPDLRLLTVTIDDAVLAGRSAAQEADVRAALADLPGGRFAPALDVDGPFRVALDCPDGRLSIAVSDADGRHLRTYGLAMTGLRALAREYLAMLDAYEAAWTRGGASLETVDMARRGVHNAAGEKLMERLGGKIEMDAETARRLWTLVAALHCRG